MTVTILKSVIIIVILAIMILVLLGINHFFSGNFSVGSEDADSLRKDVEEKEDVVTPGNLFGEFVRRK